MVLTYTDIFSEKRQTHRVKATVTTEHSASHYGQPVIVLPDGNALDLISWVALNYRVIKASKREYHVLHTLGLA